MNGAQQHWNVSSHLNFDEMIWRLCLCVEEGKGRERKEIGESKKNDEESRTL